MIDKSECERKPLYKKFLDDTKNIKLIDEYRMFWLLDYNIYYLYDKWGFEGETCKYRNQYEENTSNIMVEFFFHYFKSQVGLLQNILI